MGSREALIDGVDDALHSGSDDAAASCGSGNQEETAIRAGDYRRCDGRKRAFPGSDIVCDRWDISKLV